MRILATFGVAALLAANGCGQPHDSQRALAAARVTELGGSVQFGPETIVNLANTQTGDADLKWLTKFSQLEEIDLTQTQITDAGLRFLGDLPDLRRVVVSGCQVTKVALSALRRRRPELSIVE